MADVTTVIATAVIPEPQTTSSSEEESRRIKAQHKFVDQEQLARDLDALKKEEERQWWKQKEEHARLAKAASEHGWSDQWQKTRELHGFLLSRDADFDDFQERKAREEASQGGANDLWLWLRRREKALRDEGEHNQESWDSLYLRRRKGEAIAMRVRERERRSTFGGEETKTLAKARRELLETSRQSVISAATKEAERRAKGEAQWKSVQVARAKQIAAKEGIGSFLARRKDEIYEGDQRERARKLALKEMKRKARHAEGKERWKLVNEERMRAERDAQEKLRQQKKDHRDFYKAKFAEDSRLKQRDKREVEELEARKAEAHAQREKVAAVRQAERTRQAAEELEQLRLMIGVKKVEHVAAHAEPTRVIAPPPMLN